MYLRERDAKMAAIFSFFIGITSFFNIMGEMGASLRSPSFIRIRELLPSKTLLLPPFFYSNIVSSHEDGKKCLAINLNYFHDLRI